MINTKDKSEPKQITCATCKQGGGTLVKVGEEKNIYKHQDKGLCLYNLRGRRV